MTWTAHRHSWLALALAACAPDLVEMDSGNTTTTYGTTNNGTSEADDSDDGVDPDPSDTDPSESGPNPTDDGPDPSDDGPDPSDDGPDPTDEGPDSGPIFDLPPEPGLPNGSTCTDDSECSSGNCYVVPFLGGQCGECNEDADCADGGCTPPNPFEALGSHCNMGEPGGGCESDAVCANGLTCSNVLDLLGLITIDTCGHCESDADCGGNEICAPLVNVAEFSGLRDCITPGTLPQDSFCELSPGNGDEACGSGICSTVDIMGLAEVGACGECNTDNDCGNGTCAVGEFILDTGTLVGSTCQ